MPNMSNRNNMTMIDAGQDIFHVMIICSSLRNEAAFT